MVCQYIIQNATECQNAISTFLIIFPGQADFDTSGLAQRAGKPRYLFHDLTRKMPAEAAVILQKRMEELSSRGAWLCFCLRDQLLYDINLDRKFQNNWFGGFSYNWSRLYGNSLLMGRIFTKIL